MKVAFLCSSIEANRDGVGDYTLALAAELGRRNVECKIVALNEPSLGSVVQSESELRLPGGMKWERRICELDRTLRTFSPDWVSIQFSPYGFQTKGLPVGFRRLKSILAPYRAHLMFHELWIGENTECGWRKRIWGLAQKRGTLRLLRLLRPAVIQTSNPVYQTLLAANGFKTEVLPLFGSIPVVDRSSDSRWMDSLKPLVPPNKACLWMGVFGSIHPEWYPKSFFDELIKTADKLKVHPVLAVIGWAGSAGDTIVRRIANDYADYFPTVILGEQPAERVSQFLQGMDLAIATSPWALIGKSSTVATMLDHGLPVVVPRDDWKLRSYPTPSPLPHPLLFQPDGFLSQLRRGLPRRSPVSRLAEIGSQFIASLSKDTVICRPEPLSRMAQCLP